MFISIIWGWDTWEWCAPSACWTCSSWC
jgi:hypothetical protein